MQVLKTHAHFQKKKKKRKDCSPSLVTVGAVSSDTLDVTTIERGPELMWRSRGRYNSCIDEEIKSEDLSLLNYWLKCQNTMSRCSRTRS
jgi:hypothetical protein